MECVRGSGGDAWTGVLSSSHSSSMAVVVDCLLLLIFPLGSGNGFVDRWFALSWSRCPFIMAMERGAYFLTRFDVSSGHVVNHPLSIALHHVDRTGEKQQAW